MSRDQFEQLLADRLANEYPTSAEQLRRSMVGLRDGDEYAGATLTGRMIAKQATLAWWAWQASRAAVVVELPRTTYYGDLQYGYGVDACRAAIEAAGLKVAP